MDPNKVCFKRRLRLLTRLAWGLAAARDARLEAPKPELNALGGPTRHAPRARARRLARPRRLLTAHRRALSPSQYRPSSAFNTPYWTTNAGAPVWNNNNSETVGVRGASPAAARRRRRSLALRASAPIHTPNSPSLHTTPTQAPSFSRTTSWSRSWPSSTASASPSASSTRAAPRPRASSRSRTTSRTSHAPTSCARRARRRP
jgi:hypothetical protein